MTSSLTGYAMITGAASGIGKATALAFARAGCAGLHLSDLNVAALESVVKECTAAATNKECLVLTDRVDVTKEKEVYAMVAHAKERFGRVDYAVNSAGIVGNSGWPPVPLLDITAAIFDEVQAVNVRGLLHCVQAQIKCMLKQEEVQMLEPPRPKLRGSIVNMASLAGSTPFEGFAAYCVSKKAVIGVTRSAAKEHTPDGIRVNCVCPAFVDTPMVTVMPEEARELFKTGSWMNRFGTAEEVADVIVFLSSPQASFVSGAAWSVDGGA